MLSGTSPDIFAARRRKVMLCKAANFNCEFFSRRKMNCTAPLQRLQTPSKKTIASAEAAAELTGSGVRVDPANNVAQHLAAV